MFFSLFFFVVPAMGSGYLRLYDDISTHQHLQQPQLWHQRYIRDVGATLSASLQQQQQQENLKDSLQQSSSTEVSLEQPQGMCKKNSTQFRGNNSFPLFCLFLKNQIKKKYASLLSQFLQGPLIFLLFLFLRFPFFNFLLLFSFSLLPFDFFSDYCLCLLSAFYLYLYIVFIMSEYIFLYAMCFRPMSIGW